MPIQVPSPPLSSKVPQSLAKTNDERVYWKNLNDFLFRLWRRTGGGEDIISDVAETAIRTPVEVQAAIEDIRQRLGSGQFLTSDCDTFTVDSETLYTEMTEA